MQSLNVIIFLSDREFASAQESGCQSHKNDRERFTLCEIIKAEY